MDFKEGQSEISLHAAKHYGMLMEPRQRHQKGATDKGFLVRWDSGAGGGGTVSFRVRF